MTKSIHSKRGGFSKIYDFKDFFILTNGKICHAKSKVKIL